MREWLQRAALQFARRQSRNAARELEANALATRLKQSPVPPVRQCAQKMHTPGAYCRAAAPAPEAEQKRRARNKKWERAELHRLLQLVREFEQQRRAKLGVLPLSSFTLSQRHRRHPPTLTHLLVH